MKYLIFGIIIAILMPITVFAGSGCCSWHGGIDYCGSNGYYICNDGTQSPSCTCYSGGGIELTDTSCDCDYSYYKSEIEKLNSEITDLKNDKNHLKDELDVWKSDFYTLMFFVAMYIFYKIFIKKKNNSSIKNEFKKNNVEKQLNNIAANDNLRTINKPEKKPISTDTKETISFIIITIIIILIIVIIALIYKFNN